MKLYSGKDNRKQLETYLLTANLSQLSKVYNALFVLGELSLTELI